ncbi:MAG: acetyltransferase [Oscillospiraceae bacterium]|nr:acetyltransferase [Oscillospiraceae bacterium]
MLIIIGAGGHGKVVADIASLCGYKEIAFIDDDTSLSSGNYSYPVIDIVENTMKYKDSDFFVAIGNASVRERIYKKLIEERLNIVTLIHPSAVTASGIDIGKGTVIMAGAIINPGSTIGNGCIINTAATVDHDCTINDFAHISVGAHLGGTVNIGRSGWIGIGAAVINNTDICDNCMIGGGAVVVNNIDTAGTYVGNPAKLIKKHI